MSSVVQDLTTFLDENALVYAGCQMSKVQFPRHPIILPQIHDDGTDLSPAQLSPL